MSKIVVEESKGTSEHSFTNALANAIKGALKGFDGDHKINITVVIDGYKFEAGEYKVSVRVLVLDITMEQEKALHDSEKELNERINANQNLSEQMIASVYNRNIYDSTQPINALEDRMDIMSDQSNGFDFDTNQDSITLVAPQEFHDQLRADYMAQQSPQNDLNANPPTLDLGTGSSSSSNKEGV
jgi:hypothetical protein